MMNSHMFWRRGVSLRVQTEYRLRSKALSLSVYLLLTAAAVSLAKAQPMSTMRSGPGNECIGSRAYFAGGALNESDRSRLRPVVGALVEPEQLEVATAVPADSGTTYFRTPMLSRSEGLNQRRYLIVLPHDGPPLVVVEWIDIRASRKTGADSAHVSSCLSSLGRTLFSYHVWREGEFLLLALAGEDSHLLPTGNVMWRMDSRDNVWRFSEVP